MIFAGRRISYLKKKKKTMWVNHRQGGHQSQDLVGSTSRTRWGIKRRKRKRRKRRRRKPPLCREEWEAEPVGRRGVEAGEYVHNMFNKILKELIKTLKKHVGR